MFHQTCHQRRLGKSVYRADAEQRPWSFVNSKGGNDVAPKFGWLSRTCICSPSLIQFASPAWPVCIGLGISCSWSIPVARVCRRCGFFFSLSSNQIDSGVFNLDTLLLDHKITSTYHVYTCLQYILVRNRPPHASKTHGWRCFFREEWPCLAEMMFINTRIYIYTNNKLNIIVYTHIWCLILSLLLPQPSCPWKFRGIIPFHSGGIWLGRGHGRESESGALADVINHACDPQFVGLYHVIYHIYHWSIAHYIFTYAHIWSHLGRII